MPIHNPLFLHFYWKQQFYKCKDCRQKLLRDCQVIRKTLHIKYSDNNANQFAYPCSLAFNILYSERKIKNNITGRSSQAARKISPFVCCAYKSIIWQNTENEDYWLKGSITPNLSRILASASFRKDCGWSALLGVARHS